MAWPLTVKIMIKTEDLCKVDQ